LDKSFFDQVVDRRGTNSSKWDGLKNVYGTDDAINVLKSIPLAGVGTFTVYHLVEKAFIQLKHLPKSILLWT